MSIHHLLSVPWGSDRPGQLYSAPGSLIMKMRLGEGPVNLPRFADVQAGISRPAVALDGGPIDRLLPFQRPAQRDHAPPLGIAAASPQKYGWGLRPG